MLVSAAGRPLPIADVQDVAHDIVSWLTGAAEAPTTTDWVLLGLGAVILYFLARCAAVAASSVRLEVQLLDADEPKPPIHAITAALREGLGGADLLAPVVPSGAPKAGLADAITASPVPQGALIGKLMQALPIPEPLQYTLSGSIGADKALPRMSLWCRPNDGGSELMEAFGGTGAAGGDYDEVVDAASFAVYSFISIHATKSFPHWTRWHSAKALAGYRGALEAAAQEEFHDASRLLARAALEERDNAMVFLQLANVYERNPDPGLAPSRALASKRQAEALRMYLSIADQWPWLVQARYRASVLAGALGGSCGEHGVLGGAREGLGLAQESEVEPVLIAIARAESDFTLQLLKPWYMLARWRRIRSQFEPSSEGRRALKRAVGISRHALHLRRLERSENLRARVANARQVATSEVAVRCWHLTFGLVPVDWQTQYVAACFDALLFARDDSALLLGDSSKLPKLVRRAVESRRRRWRDHLRKQALRRLDRAVADAGPALPPLWVLFEDPDLESLRDLGVDWEEATAALAARLGVSYASSPVAAVPIAKPSVPELCSPTHPWPAPGWRALAYCALLVPAALLDVILFEDGWGWRIGLTLLAAWSSWRIYVDARERARRSTVAGAVSGMPGERAPRPPSRLP